MQIAVCDNNRLFLQEFEEQLRSVPSVSAVFPFSDYNAFMLSVDDGKRYDAVFMDIDWDQKQSGMDIAEELYKLSPHSRIIYVTGHSELYSQRIFLSRSNLSGFLTKPVDPALLHANLKKVVQELPYGEQPALLLKRKGAPVSIPLRKLLFIE